MVDYHLIMDLIPTVAHIFFLKQLGDIPISVAQCVRIYTSSGPRMDLFVVVNRFVLTALLQALLLGVGLQHKSVDQLEKEIDLPSSQLMGLFNRLIRKFVQVSSH